MAVVAAARQKLLGSLRSRWLLGDSPAHFALLSLLLVVAIVEVYWPVHTHGYVGGDDYFYVVDNVHMHHGMDWTTVKWAFTARDMVNWIPLTWLSHAADYSFFGADPAGHHVVNLLLHALAAVLLFWTLKRATGFLGRSFMVAALFALHPINVEPVAWVAELKTVLSMIFFVLALAAYRWYASQPDIARYFVVALLYGCGLMAKSQVIMLPLLLLLWDYWPLQRMFPAGSEVVAGTNSLPPLPARDFLWLVIEKVPLFVLALLDAAVTLHVQGVAHPRNWAFTFPIRTANAIIAYARYVGKALWPQSLGLSYPHLGNTFAAWQVIGASAVLLAITALVLLARRRRYLAVGWLWFLISLLPMSGIVPFGDQAMQDRYAYQSFCGFFLMVCWSAADWGRGHLPSPILVGVSTAILIVLTLLTYRQVNYWGDDLVLCTHALEVAPNSPWAEDCVGGVLIRRGRTAEALKHFARAISLDPDDPYGNLQLAFHEHQYGDMQKAISYYERVLRTPRSNPEERWRSLINMGHVYGNLGDLERARQCFEAAAKIPAEQFGTH